MANSRMAKQGSLQIVYPNMATPVYDERNDGDIIV